MMRKNYKNPEINISRFDIENILTESSTAVLDASINGRTLEDGNTIKTDYNTVFGNN